MLVALIISLLLAFMAWLIRKVLLFIDARNGYSEDEMPLHYHIFGVGTYCSILFVIWLVTVMT